MQRPRSLRSLLLLHELAFVLLVVVAAVLGGIWAYGWQQSSQESIRVTQLMYESQQLRGELYSQIKDVMRARLLEDPQALELYWDYTRQIQRHFNNLRRHAAEPEEHRRVQDMQEKYRVIQQDMNKIFTDPYASGQDVHMALLDPRSEAWLVGDFERAFAAFSDLLDRHQRDIEATVDTRTAFAALVFPVPMLLALGLLILSRRSLLRGFVRPIHGVMEGAGTMSQGELDHRIPEGGVEEVAELARAINQMAEDLARSRDALVESKKQAALGALVPVVAHNIRNPLAAIRATAQMVDDARAEDRREARDEILQTVDRLERWVTSLLSYLHPLKPYTAPARLTDMLASVERLAEPKRATKSVTVRHAGWDHDREVDFDVDLVEQAVFGLLVNAIEASPEGGTVTLGLEVQPGLLELVVQDEGAGLPFDPEPEQLAPLRSTKRYGTGLGIPFAFKVCQAHGWQLRFEAAEPHGTRVVVSIPLREDDSGEVVS